VYTYFVASLTTATVDKSLVFRPWFFIFEGVMYNRNWGKDRRRFQRLCLNLGVWYRGLRPDEVCNMLGNSERQAVTLDISLLGMAFACSYKIPIFSYLALKFIIFAAKNGICSNLAIPVEVKAQVLSCVSHENEYRIGVSFTGIDFETQQKLAHFIRESSRPYIEF